MRLLRLLRLGAMLRVETHVRERCCKMCALAPLAIGLPCVSPVPFSERDPHPFFFLSCCCCLVSVAAFCDALPVLGGKESFPLFAPSR